MPTSAVANPGWFKQGADARRHLLTREERQKGGRAAFLLVALERPEKVLWLKQKIRRTCTTRARSGYRRRKRLYASGQLAGSGY